MEEKDRKRKIDLESLSENSFPFKVYNALKRDGMGEMYSLGDLTLIEYDSFKHKYYLSKMGGRYPYWWQVNEVTHSYGGDFVHKAYRIICDWDEAPSNLEGPEEVLLTFNKNLDENSSQNEYDSED